MSATALANPAPTAERKESKNIIGRHPIGSVVILAFVLTWAGLIPDVLASQKLLPFEMPLVLSFLTGWAPGVAAILVTGFSEGRLGIVNLLKRFLIVRVGIQWYFLVLGAMAILTLAGAGMFVLTGGRVTVPALQYPVTSVAFGFVLALALGFVFNTEEMLWRGFMLPRLQRKHTALGAAFLIAIPETLLHVPYFFSKSVAFYQNVGPVAFAVFTLALTVLFAWLFNNTRGSLLLVTLAHASQNAWSNLLSDNQPMPFYFTVSLLVVAAVVVVVVFGAKRLVRGGRVAETGWQE